MFHEDARGVAGSVFNGSVQFLAVVGATDADRRAEVGRFHDYRITEFRLDFICQSGFFGEPLAVGEPYIVDHGYTVGTEYHLHRDFVHAVGRGECVAACVWDAD